jgi:hypothetical protein
MRYALSYAVAVIATEDIAAMPRQPEHPPGPAFREASEYTAQQLAKLSPAERKAYDELCSSHVKRQSRLERRLEILRSALTALTTAPPGRPKLTLDPPFKGRDPQIRRLARGINTLTKTLVEMQREDETARRNLLDHFTRAPPQHPRFSDIERDYEEPRETDTGRNLSREFNRKS